MTTPVWIGLGSNLGDRKGILDAAIAALADAPGVAVEAVSSYHETSPVGGPAGQGAFLNAAARLATTLDPHQLLAVLREIESRAGRVREVRWGERTLDLDILYFDHLAVSTEDLKIPHPRLAVRRFVLAPLAEIAPRFVDPMTGQTIANLLANLDRRPRLIAIDGERGPLKTAVFERLVEELPGFGISEADLGLDEFEHEQASRDEARTHADELRAQLFYYRRKAEALDARRWAAESLRVDWIVVDHSLDRDLIRSLLSLSREDRSRPRSMTTIAGDPDWTRRIFDLESIVLPPSFVLILPTRQNVPRWFGRTSPPILRPETDDPDDIVKEVLATCRGIEGP
jgi:2-amino-4-hydroxy-6-hydroxymethyldihydropteridine diphosphokinase